jgi:RNA polymerase sigma factor (sigma-70 family)
MPGRPIRAGSTWQESAGRPETQPRGPSPCYERLMDEPQLLAALAADLDRSFEALVVAHGDRVYSIALRLVGDPHEAEDVAQDALARAYRALAGWDATRIRELRLGAWLATIVLNLVRNRARRRTPPNATETITFLDDLAHPTAASADTPHDRLARRETGETWAARLLALPARYRAPIVLRHVENLGYSEIAEILGRPQGTIKAQVHRGLELLRAALEAERRAGDALEDLRSSCASAFPPPAPRLQEVPR